MVWDGSSGESTASVQATGSDITDIFRTVGELRTMKVEPLQMHWHSPSEHAVNGVFVRSPAPPPQHALRLRPFGYVAA